MATKRSYWLHVRLTPDEMLLVEQNALALRVSVSAYVRSLLSIPIQVSTDDSEKLAQLPSDAVRIVIYDTDTYWKIRYQIRAWGNLYNQAVHALNIIQSKRFLPADETYQLFTKAINLLEEINNEKEKFYSLVRGLPIAPHVNRRSHAKSETKVDDQHAVL